MSMLSSTSWTKCNFF